MLYAIYQVMLVFRVAMAALASAAVTECHGEWRRACALCDLSSDARVQSCHGTLASAGMTECHGEWRRACALCDLSSDVRVQSCHGRTGQRGDDRVLLQFGTESHKFLPLAFMNTHVSTRARRTLPVVYEH